MVGGKQMRYLSVFEKDEEILKAISDIFLKGKWFDLDCTYSKGVFYNNIEKPRIVSDLEPQYEYVVQSDCTKLDFIEDGCLESIVFDPPFLFRNRKSINNDRISARFTYFNSYEELQEMYQKSLDCFKKKLKKGGIVCFKCQDMTDGKFYCTHNFIINYALQIGFTLKDIIIKKSNTKLQRDAKQQNCVAKIHSYWIILKL
jgi:hypothetical protein